MSRRDFAELVDEMARIVQEQDPESALRVKFPGYDRPFDSGDELLENVPEEEWSSRTIRRSFDVTVSSHNADIPSVLLDVHPSTWGHVSLILIQGTRRERNALLPDLRSMVARHARPRRSHKRVLVWMTGIGMLLALPCTLAFTLTVGKELSLLPALACVLLISFVVASLAQQYFSRRILRAIVAVELLPDDRRSSWDQAIDRVKRDGRIAATAVLGAATVAGAVFAGMAVL